MRKVFFLFVIMLPLCCVSQSNDTAKQTYHIQGHLFNDMNELPCFPGLKVEFITMSNKIVNTVYPDSNGSYDADILRTDLPINVKVSNDFRKRETTEFRDVCEYLSDGLERGGYYEEERIVTFDFFHGGDPYGEFIELDTPQIDFYLSFLSHLPNSDFHFVKNTAVPLDCHKGCIDSAKMVISCFSFNNIHYGCITVVGCADSTEKNPLRLAKKRARYLHSLLMKAGYYKKGSISLEYKIIGYRSERRRFTSDQQSRMCSYIQGHSIDGI